MGRIAGWVSGERIQWLRYKSLQKNSMCMSLKEWILRSVATMSQRHPVLTQCEKQLKKWAVDKIIQKTNSDCFSEKYTLFSFSKKTFQVTNDKMPSAQAQQPDAKPHNSFVCSHKKNVFRRSWSGEIAMLWVFWNRNNICFKW